MGRNDFNLNRRGFLTAGALFAVAATGLANEKDTDEGVSPIEDLMREHGLLRRILLIYEKSANILESDQKQALNALAQSAAIIRSFVEDYYEKLEEDYLFIRFRKAGKLINLVDVLAAQHTASRKLTDIIIDITNASSFGSSEKRQLNSAISSFIRVYRPHAAREDTVLFPALREVVDSAEYAKLGDIFEQQEQKLFGQDGFSNMVEKVASIEKKLGIYDLTQFTPSVSI